jgi:hypothetical protein
MGRFVEVTFIIPVNDEKVYSDNFCSSPMLGNKDYVIELLPMRNYTSAGKAYNAGRQSARYELLVFCHQDMVFPFSWLNNVNSAIEELDRSRAKWGLLGVWGRTENGNYIGNILDNANGRLGNNFKTPQKVQTIDEIVLIQKKSDFILFDEHLPYFHFYGTDIALTSFESGRTNYIIHAPCFHNTNKIYPLPKEFMVCYKYILHKWRQRLPIYSTCVKIDRISLMVLRFQILKDSIKLRLLHVEKKKRVSNRDDILRSLSQFSNYQVP